MEKARCGKGTLISNVNIHFCISSDKEKMITAAKSQARLPFVVLLKVQTIAWRQ